MRCPKNHVELAMNHALLGKIAERIQRDYENACERGDIQRGLRHANRINLIEERLVIESPVDDISNYSDFK
jgi:hypothetical protein